MLHSGRYPHKHSIGGVLARQGLIPISVERSHLNRLLDHHTWGSYGFHLAFTEAEVEAAIEVAERFLEAVHAWPNARFQPPLTDWD